MTVGDFDGDGTDDLAGRYAGLVDRHLNRQLIFHDALGDVDRRRLGCRVRRRCQRRAGTGDWWYNDWWHDNDDRRNQRNRASDNSGFSYTGGFTTIIDTIDPTEFDLPDALVTLMPSDGQVEGEFDPKSAKTFRTCTTTVPEARRSAAPLVIRPTREATWKSASTTRSSVTMRPRRTVDDGVDGRPRGPGLQLRSHDERHEPEVAECDRRVHAGMPVSEGGATADERGARTVNRLLTLP